MPAPVPVIDAWLQHPSPAFLNSPLFSSLRRWTKMAVPNELPLEFTLSMMDAGGIEHALCSAWWGPAGPLISNDEVAATVERAPERLSGVASVPLDSPMEAVRELRRAIKELGFRGLRVLPWLWRLPPNDRRYYPLYAECVELGVPFCLQVGHTGPMAPSEYGRPIPYLDDVALEFPELTIVAGHIGYPWTDEMVSLATKYENVYIDTSAYKSKRYPPALVSFMKRHGRHKVLFGSNHPMILPGDCLKDLESLGLDEEATRLFLRDNAKRVFRLES